MLADIYNYDETENVSNLRKGAVPFNENIKRTGSRGAAVFYLALAVGLHRTRRQSMTAWSELGENRNGIIVSSNRWPHFSVAWRNAVCGGASVLTFLLAIDYLQLVDRGNRWPRKRLNQIVSTVVNYDVYVTGHSMLQPATIGSCLL